MKLLSLPPTERADPCDPTACKLPNCACANERQPPKGLSAKQVPQMILISWEDGGYHS